MEKHLSCSRAQMQGWDGLVLWGWIVCVCVWGVSFCVFGGSRSQPSVICEMTKSQCSCSSYDLPQGHSAIGLLCPWAPMTTSLPWLTMNELLTYGLSHQTVVSPCSILFLWVASINVLPFLKSGAESALNHKTE